MARAGTDPSGWGRSVKPALTNSPYTAHGFSSGYITSSWQPACLQMAFHIPWSHPSLGEGWWVAGWFDHLGWDQDLPESHSSPEVSSTLLLAS
jgi:hypothetical protein